MTTQNVIQVVVNATSNAAPVFGAVGKGALAMGGLIGGAALAAGAAAVTLSKLALKLNETALATTNMARRIGIGVEAMSRLEGAAALADVPVQSLGTALQFMNRNIANAALQGGEAAVNFSRFGLSVEALNRMNPEQKLAAIADALQRTTNAGERASLATMTFGRSGQQMIQMLDGGAAGLNAMTAEAERFGAVMSTKVAAGAMALDDAMDRVQFAVRGVSNAFLEQMQPLLTGVLNEFAVWLADNRKAIADWVNTAIINLGAFIIMVGRWVVLIKNAFIGLGTLIGEAFGYLLSGNLGKDIADTIVGAVTWIAGRMLAFGKWLLNLFSVTFQAIGNTIIGVMQTALATLVDLAVTMGKRVWKAFTDPGSNASFSDDMAAVFNRASADFIARQAGVWDQVGEFAAGTWSGIKTTAGETWGAIGDGLLALGSTIDTFLTESGLAEAFNFSSAQEQMRAFAKSMQDTMPVLEETLSAGAEAADTFWTYMGERSTEFQAQFGSVTEEMANNIFDLYMNTATAIGDAFGQAIASGQSLSKALKNILQQVLASIISMLVRIGIQRLVLAKIDKLASASAAAQKLGAGLAEVYTNSFASAAAIPLIGWAMAPGIAASNLAIAMGGAAAASGAGASLGAASGAMHGGMTYVPNETTYLLQKGERVVSPQQNRDLTEFMRGGNAGNGGAGTTIEIPVGEDTMLGPRSVRQLAHLIDEQTSKYGVRVRTTDKRRRRARP